MRTKERDRRAGATRLATYAAFGMWALVTAGLATHAFAQPAAMIYGTDANSLPDSVSLPQPTEKWFTQGNGTSINGTQVPSYWVNKAGGEISTAIQSACGASLNMAAYNQLSACLAAIQGQHGRLLGVAVFTASGTFTPVAGAASYEIEMAGGGGGGGGAGATDSGHISVGSGGSAGSYAHFTTTAGLSGAIVTIGAGGAGGTPGNVGAAGGVTSVSGAGYCSATGTSNTELAPTGTIGQVGAGAAASTPCSITGQTLDSALGAPGWNGLLFGTSIQSGFGGASFFGPGGGNSNGGGGGSTTSPGAGGGGAGCMASCGGYSGANGAPGIVIIRQYS